MWTLTLGVVARFGSYMHAYHLTKYVLYSIACQGRTTYHVDEKHLLSMIMTYELIPTIPSAIWCVNITKSTGSNCLRSG